MLYIDIKKLGRFRQTGYRVTSDHQKKGQGMAGSASTSASTLGVTAQRVVADNDPCYRSEVVRKVCADCGIGHIRTAPDPTHPRPTARLNASSKSSCTSGPMPTLTTPQISVPTNCFTATTWYRPHGSLNAQAPIDHLALTENNLLRLHT